MSAVTQTSVLVKGLKDLGVTIPIQDGPVAGHPAIFAQGPEAVEGLYVIGAGVLNPSQLPDNYPSKQVMLDFVTRFQAKYNSPASLFAGLGYDSAHILFEGLKAGVDDTAKIRDGIEAIQDLPISQGVVQLTRPQITRSTVATTSGKSRTASSRSYRTLN